MKLLRSLVVFFMSFYSFAQDFKEHVVASGETILAISKSYDIDASEIYRYNRFALEGVSEGMTLKFPVPSQSRTENVTIVSDKKSDTLKIANIPSITELPKKEVGTASSLKAIESEMKKSVLKSQKYTVQQGETLYSLSKRFEVTINELYDVNPGLKEKGLQARQILNIPLSGMVFEKTEIENNSENAKPAEANTIKHKVKKGETLYGLSVRYGISVDKIKKENESLLKNGLQTGQTLIINR